MNLPVAISGSFFVYAGKDKATSTTHNTDVQNSQTNDRLVGDEATRFTDDETNDRLFLSFFLIVETVPRTLLLKLFTT